VWYKTATRQLLLLHVKSTYQRIVHCRPQSALYRVDRLPLLLPFRSITGILYRTVNVRTSCYRLIYYSYYTVLVGVLGPIIRIMYLRNRKRINLH